MREDLRLAIARCADHNQRFCNAVAPDLEGRHSENLVGTPQADNLIPADSTGVRISSIWK
jgi:hypothetical protein